MAHTQKWIHKGNIYMMLSIKCGLKNTTAWTCKRVVNYQNICNGNLKPSVRQLNQITVIKQMSCSTRCYHPSALLIIKCMRSNTKSVATHTKCRLKGHIKHPKNKAYWLENHTWGLSRHIYGLKATYLGTTRTNLKTFLRAASCMVHKTTRHNEITIIF